jgi:hypothetical protein
MTTKASVLVGLLWCFFRVLPLLNAFTFLPLTPCRVRP